MEGRNISEKSLRELGLFILQKRRLWGNHIAVFEYLKELIERDVDKHFLRVCCNRTRGSGFKHIEGQLRFDIRKDILQ